jgi:hypothetical protein
MDIKERETNRGFQMIEFDDYYGQHCSLQMSSLAEPPCIWLGVDNTGDRISFPNRYPGDGEPNVDVGVRMHLTDEQVKELIKYLKRFIKNDKLF